MGSAEGDVGGDVDEFAKSPEGIAEGGSALVGVNVSYVSTPIGIVPGGAESIVQGRFLGGGCNAPDITDALFLVRDFAAVDCWCCNVPPKEITSSAAASAASWSATIRRSR
jgi:hypothetical protein